MASERGQPLIVLLGPTASGKTRLALELAAALGTEIVSADSVQVYRDLDIGSAKPTADERRAVAHHGLDLFDPREGSHAGRWLAAAEPALAELRARGRTPIVCGGTGLYVRALLLGLSPIPDIHAEVRVAARAECEADPLAAHAALARLDPATAARLAPRDLQRVSRALEVARATGRPLSAWHADEPPAPRYEARVFVLTPAVDALEARIASRARAMISAGLVDEVSGLLARGVPPDAPGLMTMGYREVVAALARSALDVDALAAELARAHRQYAKRQRTWFRGSGMAGIAFVELDPDRPDAARALLALGA